MQTRFWAGLQHGTGHLGDNTCTTSVPTVTSRQAWTSCSHIWYPVFTLRLFFHYLLMRSSGLSPVSYSSYLLLSYFSHSGGTYPPAVSLILYGKYSLLFAGLHIRQYLLDNFAEQTVFCWKKFPFRIFKALLFPVMVQDMLPPHMAPRPMEYVTSKESEKQQKQEVTQHCPPFPERRR